MTTTVTVEVTKKHYKEAMSRRKNATKNKTYCSNCLLATAISEVVNTPVEVALIYAGGPCGTWHAMMPDRAVAARRQFDASAKPVLPFSFLLDIPSEFVKAVQP